MKRLSPGMWGVLILLVLLIAGGAIAQLQQSGGSGSSVTITGALPAGTNVIGHVITDSGTITAVTAITNPLPAGTNVIGHVITDSGLVNTVPKTACGNTLATGSTLAAVPTSSTLLTSAATACVVRVVFFNTNAGAQTVTLTDNTATPINAVLTFSIPGLSNLIEDLGGGAFNLGVKWAAGGTGVTGYVVAYQ